MAEVTVEQLAKQAHIAVDVLLEKLKQAGLPQTSADDLISNEQKMALKICVRLHERDWRLHACETGDSMHDLVRQPYYSVALRQHWRLLQLQ